MNIGQIVKSKTTERFTTLPNELIKSEILSLEEKGFLSFLMSLPSNWVIYKKNLYNSLPDPKGKIDRVFKSLQEKGYIVSVKVIGEDGRFSGWNHVVYDEPQLENRLSETPSSTNPEVGQSAPIIKTNYIQKTDIVQKTNYINNIKSEKSLLDETESIEISPIESKQKIKKEKSSKKVEAPKLYPRMMDVYNDFCIQKIGVNAKIGALEGKSMVNIILYLQNNVKDKEGGDDAVVDAWKFILDNTERWDSFRRSQLKLNQIESNLINILNDIKNGNRQQLTKPKSISDRKNDILNSPGWNK